MATKLTKAVTRESGVQVDGRPLLVTLEPGDRISFKAKGLGEGQRVSISIEAACIVAANVGPVKAALGPDPGPTALTVTAAPTLPSDGSTPYRVSGKNIYIGARGPWVTDYGSGVYVSEELLKLKGGE